MKVVVNLERRIDPAAAKRLLELLFDDAFKTMQGGAALTESDGGGEPDRPRPVDVQCPTAPNR